MKKILFYRYYFQGKDKPVIMQAENRELADQMIEQLKQKTGVADFGTLIDVEIESPLKGVSTMKRLGVEYIWVGFDKSQDGWMEKKEFNEAVQNAKRNR